MKKVFFTIVLLLVISANSFASHVMGADITYTCLGNNVYEVTLTLYRDCSGSTIGTSPQTVNFSSSCSTLTASLAYVSTTDVSQLCPTALSTCNGGTEPGTEQYVFRGQVTLPPCADWIMSWDLCCRNSAITNLVSPSSQSLYVQTTMNSIAAPCNNSPQFLTIPTPYLCANNLSIYNHGATDLDGDSLYYSLANPLTTPGPPGSPIAFSTGYSLLQPMITTAGINLNQTTGEMCFTPSMGQIAVVSILIQEFRNGVLIGSIIREMQVIVDPSCTNQNPTTGAAATCGGAGGMTITQQGPTVTQIDGNSLMMCPNDNVCFDINFSDPDGNNITINSNVATGIPTATFTVVNNGTPNPVATFCWTPTPLDSGLNVFAVTATDDACPIIGMQTFAYDITIFDQPYAGPDQTICGPQSAQLSASGGAGYNWSVLSGDPIVVGTNFSCNPCTSPLATPSVTTTYLLTSSLSAACVNTDTVVVNVVPDFTITTTTDTTICDFLPVNIGVQTNPAGGYTVNWTPAATLNNAAILNPIASPLATTTYTATITSPFGCTKTDSVVINVNPPPSLTLVPGDTTICAGSSLNFDVNSTCDYTLEMFDSFGDGWNGQSISIYENGVLIGTYTVSSTNNGGSWNTVTVPITNGSTITIVYNTGSFQSESSFNLIDGTGATQFTVTQGGMSGWVDASTVFTGIANCGPTLSNYSFSWSPIAGLSTSTIANPVATPTATTTYVVTLTDVSGCAVNRQQTITVVPDYTLNSTQSDTSVCLGSTVNFNTIPSPSGSYTYSWTPANIMNNPNIANPVATFTTPGVNMIIVDVDNGGGCLKSDTLYVNVSATVIPNISILTPDTTLSCTSLTLPVALDLGGGIPTVCGASATTMCSGPSTQTVVGTATGSNTTTSYPAPYANWYSNAKHQFLYTAAELNALGITGGKITEIAWEITQLQSSGGNNGIYTNYTISMNCTSTTNLTTWETGLTTVYGPLDYTPVMGWNTHTFSTAYEWDGISNLVVQICYDYLTTSTYSNNALTPWSTTAFTSSIWYRSDSQPACPELTSTGTGNDRPVTRFTTCGTAPNPSLYIFDWTPGATLNDSTIQNPIANPTSSVNYIVIVSDTSGQCSDTDTLKVTIVCCITPNITSTNVSCGGGNDGQIIASATGGNPNFIIEFYDSLGTTLLQSATNVLSDTLNNITAGTYLVSITDTVGCVKKDTIVITQPTPLIFTGITSDTIVCINASLTLFATTSGGSPNIILNWDNGLVGNGPHNVSPQNNTIYHVTALDNNGCSISDSIWVTLKDTISPAIITSNATIKDSICPGSVITLATTPATGGSGSGYTYHWYDSNNNLLDSGFSVSVTPSYSGEIFSVIVGDNCTTPKQTVTIPIYWAPILSPTYTADTLSGCFPVRTNFVNTTLNSTLISQITWDFGDGSISNSLNPNVSHDFNKAGCYNTKLTITSIYGCTTDSIMPNLTICAFSYPIADFSISPQPTTYLNTEITFTNQSYNATTNDWLFTQGIPPSSNSLNPVVTFPNNDPGEYNAHLVVTNQHGCKDSTDRTVIIDGVYLFYMPNSFTPNGDGDNDFFKPKGDGIDPTNYVMYIFDRWGTKIFETNNINEGWDGTYKGELVPTGVYIWRIKTKEDFENVYHQHTGHVNLLK